jgi:hypothetical protein
MADNEKFNYHGFVVMINPTETLEKKFRDAFSIHDGSVAKVNQSVVLPQVFQRQSEEAGEFATKHEAVASATDAAQAWIDSELLKAQSK